MTLVQNKRPTNSAPIAAPVRKLRDWHADAVVGAMVAGMAAVAIVTLALAVFFLGSIVVTVVGAIAWELR